MSKQNNMKGNKMKKERGQEKSFKIKFNQKKNVKDLEIPWKWTDIESNRNNDDDNDTDNIYRHCSDGRNYINYKDNTNND